MNLLLAPHVTEKTSLACRTRNQYAFQVRRDATKHRNASRPSS